jgi:hypothetical protein
VGVAFFVLNLLLELPDLALGSPPITPVYYLSDPLRLYYLFSLDLLGLFVLLSLYPRPPRSGRHVRAVVVGSILFLFVYEAYDAAIVSMLHRDPIFYADVSHVVGAIHLFLNGGVPSAHLVGVGAGMVVLVGLARLLPSIVREIHERVRLPVVRRSVLGTAVVIGILVGVGTLTDQGIDRRTYRATCFSTTECVVRNVMASFTLNRRTARRQQGPADSTYAKYTDLHWSNPPSLYLVIFESYGAVLTSPGPARASYAQLVAGMSDTLRASGWHAASTYSAAPVFGGLSWLSVASILLGTPVKHQPTYETLRPTLPHYPHLVRLLDEQGYTTATLQPPVRSRPGLSVGNPYRFGRTFYLADLDYRGPDYGWGIVPDQYSLAVAHDRFVEQTERPFFLMFEAVDSHAPWKRPPPPLLENPTAPNRYSTERRARREADSAGPRSSRDHLLRHIRYDWRVLAGYLQTKAPRNSLVVVLGDHQPSFAEEASAAVPLHVLSRDEALVRRFGEYGFVPGLRPTPAADTLRHAGLYSLLVRTITAHDRAAAGRSARPLPPYRPAGVERTALVPDNRP